MTNTKEISAVVAALHVHADDLPPLAPYKELKKAPSNFPYEQCTVMAPADARKINQTLDALNSRVRAIKDIDETAKEMRVEIEEKIKVLQGQEKYSDIKQEMVGLKEKLAAEVEATMEENGNVLIEYNNTVLTIYEQVTEGKVKDCDVQQAIIDAINKFVSADVAGKIIAAADAAVAEAKKAGETVERQLASWPSPKDLRKKVKQELPTAASIKTANPLETLRGWFASAIEFFSGVWASLFDKIAGLTSAIQQAEPVVEELQQLSAAAGITASKTNPGLIQAVVAALAVEECLVK